MNKRQYLTKLINKKVSKKFINFYCDFETVVHEGHHNVTCYSIVGENFETSNILDILDSKDLPKLSNVLVTEFLEKCSELSKSSKNYNQSYLFFFHNLNRFDSYFLLNTLSSSDLFDVKLISRNNQVYKIVVKNKKEKVQFEFRDTLLYLPLSLEKLSLIFCSNHKKILFNQELNKLENYILNKEFKLNLLNYCIADSKALQEGFENFLQYIRVKLDIEPLMCLSLPGISLRYFRTKFYNELTMPIERLNRNKDNFIRKSYRGGSVDVFKPHLKNGFHYDVNSLYPYIMKSSPMPIGIGEWVNIDNIENFFGFVKVEVESPSYLHKPFLHSYNKELGLITPLGKWSEIYFSEEIKYALTLGYKFKYLKGLSYKQGIIFSDFIDTLYNIRLQYKKEEPLNTIAKLLMNSLYGRFGMKTNMPKSKLIANTELDNYIYGYDVIDISHFENKSLVNFRETPIFNKVNQLLQNNCIDIQEYTRFQNQDNSINESSAVQIASAITAYARIFMHRFKNDSALDVYYSDTDSIFCQNPLLSTWVSDTELGKFKLENNVIEGLFLLPKLYMIKNGNLETIVKCKGINNELLTESDIYNAYFNSSTIIKDFVSYFKRDFKKFTISQKSSQFKISSALLKRKKVFKNQKWVDTDPIRL